jgi:hypothetical protein
MIYTKDMQETEAFYQKLSQQSLFKVYKRAAVPRYLNHNKTEKIGDLVLIADAPYTFTYSETPRVMENPGGTHGYDPFENKNMATILYIDGPKIKKNYKISPIENIHLYPLVAHLLDLKILTPIDGSLEAISSVLTEK